MNENQMKIITEGLLKASKLGTINSLDCIKKGLEAYKKVEIPRVSEDGQYCYGVRIPYKEDKGVQSFIDFMIIYLDEAIKMFNKEEKQND